MQIPILELLCGKQLDKGLGLDVSQMFLKDLNDYFAWILITST